MREKLTPELLDTAPFGSLVIIELGGRPPSPFAMKIEADDPAVRWVDEDGDRFGAEEACIAWSALLDMLWLYTPPLFAAPDSKRQEG